MKVSVLPSEIDELEIVLRNLDFEDNFKCFKVTGVDVGPGAEISIPNYFKDGTIPSQFLIVMAQRKTNGTISMTMGDAPWTSSNLSLRNDGTASAVISIVFLR